MVRPAPSSSLLATTFDALSIRPREDWRYPFRSRSKRLRVGVEWTPAHWMHTQKTFARKLMDKYEMWDSQPECTPARVGGAKLVPATEKQSDETPSTMPCALVIWPGIHERILVYLLWSTI